MGAGKAVGLSAAFADNSEYLAHVTGMSMVAEENRIGVVEAFEERVTLTYLSLYFLVPLRLVRVWHDLPSAPLLP